MLFKRLSVFLTLAMLAVCATARKRSPSLRERRELDEDLRAWSWSSQEKDAMERDNRHRELTYFSWWWLLFLGKKNPSPTPFPTTKPTARPTNRPTPKYV